MKYRLKQEDKVDGTTVYVIERKSESGIWFYVEKTFTTNLAVARKCLENIKNGSTTKDTILEEYDSEAN